MILAEKIMNLRKQKGWSQEELAQQLGVSRQSVSKWESMAALPDLDKIIKISEIFGVSTDYLLRDEMEEEPGYEPAADIQNAAEAEDPYYVEKQPFSLEEATRYLDVVKAASREIALGVLLCILSPVTVMILSGYVEFGNAASLNLMTACAVGVVVLLVLIAVAVFLFVTQGMKLSKYEYLESQPLDLAYGVDGILRARKEAFESEFKARIALGVLLCILSVVPVTLFALLSGESFFTIIGAAILLLMIACGVYLFVGAGLQMESFNKLLEEGDYTYQKKVENRQNENLSKIYWCSAVALYLLLSFLTNRWELTWIIWPVAGIGWAVVSGIVGSVRDKRR